MFSIVIHGALKANFVLGANKLKSFEIIDLGNKLILLVIYLCYQFIYEFN